MSAIYIFTRDLRINDNTCFLKCCSNNNIIYPIFIFTHEQTNSKLNKFKSANAIQFMIESLIDLNLKLKNKLTCIHDKLYNAFNNIIIFCKNNNCKSIYITKDYTLFAHKREQYLKQICIKNNIQLNIFEDYCLYYPNSILTGNGQPYQKFTPYKNACIKSGDPKKVNNKIVKNPMNCINNIPNKIHISKAMQILLKQNESVQDKANTHGGRNNALDILKSIYKFKDYDKTRDMLDENTTHLSAYIKFGCVSIREVYWKVRNNFGINHGIISQLLWRDFYYQLGYAFKKVLNGKSLKDKYDKIIWNNNKSNINAWKKGKTGYPIVDASMRQLNQTGYMHNRGRLIVASFLVKILLIDWRIGEKYFAQKLLDYDPLVNNGNWQWISGSGADSQPYFRIFNPFLQAKRFDTNNIYIKKWVNELTDIEYADFLKKWDKKLKPSKYSDFIINYVNAKQKVIKAYKKIV